MLSCIASCILFWKATISISIDSNFFAHIFSSAKRPLFASGTF
jgi:hypothetical protein